MKTHHKCLRLRQLIGAWCDSGFVCRTPPPLYEKVCVGDSSLPKLVRQACCCHVLLAWRTDDARDPLLSASFSGFSFRACVHLGHVRVPDLFLSHRLRIFRRVHRDMTIASAAVACHDIVVCHQRSSEPPPPPLPTYPILLPC